MFEAMHDDILSKDEIRQFERLLQQQKVGNIEARLQLWRIFLSVPTQHLTVHELYQELRARGWNWGVELALDTLELLVSFGLVSKSYLNANTPRYEHSKLEEHHDHLLCMRCGRITEFYSDKLEELQQTIIKEQGFHPLSHKLVVRGICCDCLSQRAKPVPLSQFGRGESVVVEEVGAAHGNALGDLGIITGARLNIISKNKNGMVVALNAGRMALSQEWCEQIMVRQAAQADFCKLS